jgi:hypothetical protein
MIKIGFLLITAGFLGGAYFSVNQTAGVNWTLFAGSIVFGAIGIFLVRSTQKKHARKDEVVQQNISAIEASIRNLVQNVGSLNQDKEKINPYDMAQKLDDLLIDDLNTFVTSRETIAQIYGLETYADIMNHFAAGERYINRVWSASVDGYIDEVNAYLEKGLEQFQIAQSKIQEVRSQSVQP